MTIRFGKLLNIFKNKINILKLYLYAFLSIELLSIVYFIIYFYINGRLPIPFYDDANDTFMDFFNVNYWAFKSDKYSTWHAIYPPLPFALGEIFTNNRCVGLINGFAIRECSTSDIFKVFIPYFLGVIICANKASALFLTAQIDFKNYIYTILIFITIILSLPSIFSMERGNYILITFLFITLCIFTKNTYKSALFFSASLLMKPYLVIMLLSKVLNNDYKYILKVFFFTALIYYISSLYLNDTDSYLIFSNIVSFNNDASRSIYELVTNSTSLLVWLKVLNRERFNQSEFVSANIEYFYTFGYIFALIIYSLVIMVIYRLKKSNNKLPIEVVNLIIYIIVLNLFDSI